MNRKIAIGIAVLAFLMTSSGFALAQEKAPNQRLITVVGTSEINVAPDEVALTLGVETRDKDLRTAKSQNDTRSKAVIALARSAGVDPKDISTSELRMGSEFSREKSPRLIGYEVTQTIAITLKDISKYESLMTELLESGINRIHGINFQVGQTRKYKDEARAKALRAAKEKAAAMAAELGQTIGKPWEIVEQNTDNPFSAPYGYQASSNSSFDAEAFSVRAADPTVAPGQVTIRASVQVSFVLE